MRTGENRLKTYRWTHWIGLLIVLNPITWIIEVLLGNRYPRLIMVLQDKTLCFRDRIFVPCPHCKVIHPYSCWDPDHEFGNWFGLYCPSCRGIIPCLWNVFSLLILAVSFPIWIILYWPAKKLWLRWQLKRFKNNNTTSPPINPLAETNWKTIGLAWGALMFIAMTLSKGPLPWPALLVGVCIWTLAGLAFGYTMKLFYGVPKSTAKKNDKPVK